MLWALAQNGDRRTDFLSDIVAQSKDFDSATQIRLARYLLQTPGWQSQGNAMADHLQQTLYVTGRYAVANESSSWGWLGSLVDAQSQMLQLLLERHASSEIQDGAVRSLVAQQCRCGWPTVDDTASAMTALAAYAATEHLGPASAGVAVGGKTVASAQFGSTASSQTFNLPVSSLTGNAAVVTSNGGTVHYTRAVHLQRPGRCAGRTVGVPRRPYGHRARPDVIAACDDGSARGDAGARSARRRCSTSACA